jgi:hypothetical protein
LRLEFLGTAADTSRVMVTPSQRFAAAFALTFLLGGAAGYFAGNRPPPVVPGTSKHTPNSTASAPGSAEAPSEPAGEDARREGVPLTGEADIASSILSAVRARDYFRRRHDYLRSGATTRP